MTRGTWGADQQFVYRITEDDCERGIAALEALRMGGPNRGAQVYVSHGWPDADSSRVRISGYRWMRGSHDAGVALPLVCALFAEEIIADPSDPVMLRSDKALATLAMPKVYGPLASEYLAVDQGAGPYLRTQVQKRWLAPLFRRSAWLITPGYEVGGYGAFADAVEPRIAAFYREALDLPAALRDIVARRCLPAPPRAVTWKSKDVPGAGLSTVCCVEG